MKDGKRQANTFMKVLDKLLLHAEQLVFCASIVL
jgi:hypothetical protein